MTVTGENATGVILASIPELTVDVDGDEDFYLTFAELFRWIESCTQAGKIENLRRAVQLVDSILQDCDPDVRNAVAVAFLESVDPDDPVGRTIFNELSPRSKQLWQDLDLYMQELIGKSLRGSVSRMSSKKH